MLLRSNFLRGRSQRCDQQPYCLMLLPSAIFIPYTALNITKEKCLKNSLYALTLILLTWKIWRAPNNASKWLMGCNSAFKGLTLILLTWTKWRAPNNASKWRMGCNSAFKVLTLILLTWTIWRASTNVSKWRMGFNSAFNPYPANVDNMASSYQC